MSGGELIMDKEISGAFQKVYDKIDALPCADRGERIAKLEQWKLNGAEQKLHGLTIWRIAIAAIGLAIIVLEVMKKL